MEVVKNHTSGVSILSKPVIKCQLQTSWYYQATQSSVSEEHLEEMVQKGKKLLIGKDLPTDTSSRVTESGDRKEEQAEERMWQIRLHRIIEWIVLEGTSKIKFQPRLYHKQRGKG